MLLLIDPSACGDSEEVHVRKAHPGKAGKILHEEQLGPGTHRHGTRYVAKRSFTLNTTNQSANHALTQHCPHQ